MGLQNRERIGSSEVWVVWNETKHGHTEAWLTGPIYLDVESDDHEHVMETAEAALKEIFSLPSFG